MSCQGMIKIHSDKVSKESANNAGTFALTLICKRQHQSFDQVGRYEFSIYASLNGEKLAEDRVMVYARKADLEFENFAMNRTLLEKIAKETGARFFLGREAELALSELRGTQHIVTRHTDRDIWDRWYVLALILTLLSAEWFLRKRAGLA